MTAIMMTMMTVVDDSPPDLHLPVHLSSDEVHFQRIDICIYFTLLVDWLMKITELIQYRFLHVHV